MSGANLSCCCGRSDCAYLHHNNIALSGLERDVETAARLGQVRATPILYTRSRHGVIGQIFSSSRDICILFLHLHVYLLGRGRSLWLLRGRSEAKILV